MLAVKAYTIAEEAAGLSSKGELMEAQAMYQQAIEKLNEASLKETDEISKAKFLSIIQSYETNIDILKQREVFADLDMIRKLNELKKGVSGLPKIDVPTALEEPILIPVTSSYDKMKKLENLAGLAVVKHLLRRILSTAKKETPEDEAKTVLLYGPPGTGKTTLAIACSGDTKIPLLYTSCSVNPPKDGNTTFFKTLIEKGKAVAPAIIFVDDVEYLCTQKTPLYQDMRKSLITDAKELEKTLNVHLIGATNKPWEIDDEVRKVFEKRIFVPKPNLDDRVELFQLSMPLTETDIKKEDLVEFAKMTEGLTGHYISILIKDMLLEPIRKCRDATRYKKRADGFIEPAALSDPEGFPCTLSELENPKLLKAPNLTKTDAINILKNIQRPDTSPELMAFQKWEKEFGSGSK